MPLVDCAARTTPPDHNQRRCNQHHPARDGDLLSCSAIARITRVEGDFAAEVRSHLRLWVDDIDERAGLTGVRRVVNCGQEKWRDD